MEKVTGRLARANQRVPPPPAGYDSEQIPPKDTIDKIPKDTIDTPGYVSVATYM